jgi:hypothetical protein
MVEWSGKPGIGAASDEKKHTLYLLAKTLSEGSMIPPRSRRTRWRVDSFWMSEGLAFGSTKKRPPSSVPHRPRYLHSPLTAWRDQRADTVSLR